MFDEADEQLFSRVLNNKSHVLQSHLPDWPRSQYEQLHTANSIILESRPPAIHHDQDMLESSIAGPLSSPPEPSIRILIDRSALPSPGCC